MTQKYLTFIEIDVQRVFHFCASATPEPSYTKHSVMSKRPAGDPSEGGVALKDGERPYKAEMNECEAGDFEDEFEDDFDSEDEIHEAGVDGRPDEEREAEERRGTWNKPKALCE